MSGEFIFMQMLAVCGSAQDGELLRQGATWASLPIEFTSLSETAAAARRAGARDQIDIKVFVDRALAERRIATSSGAARKASGSRPSSSWLAPTREAAAGLVAGGAAADGIAVARPGKLADAVAIWSKAAWH